jgi:hypothetical protein
MKKPHDSAAEPKNEIEEALAIHMACTHAVTLAVLSRAGGAYGGDRHVARMASAGCTNAQRVRQSGGDDAPPSQRRYKSFASKGLSFLTVRKR